MKKIKKFVNDGKVYYEKVQKRDAIQAAEAWGEGFDPLIALLETCIKNGITTMSCCAGHIRDDSIFQTPYIFFEYQPGITDYLLEQMLKEQCLDEVLISRNKTTNNPSVTFYGFYQSRRNFFTNMLQYIPDYVHANGPVKPTSIRDIARAIKNRNNQVESLEGKSSIRKFLDIMRTTDLQNMLSYNPHTNLYKLLSSEAVVMQEYSEKDIEEYLLTLPKMETQTSKNSAIQIAKDMCRSASTGINEIQNIARKLQGKLQSHNLDLQTEKQEQEK